MTDCVEGLHKAEQWEVYRILHAGGLNHTRNKYGLFFDVTNAPDEVLSRVQAFLDFVEDSRAYLNKAEDVCAGCLLGCGPVDGTRAKSQSAPPGAVAGAGPAEIAPSPHATEDGSESERLKRVAGAPHAPDQHALTREQSKSVQLFVQSMVKLRDENPATKRRETSRFQAYRKKYSRPINQKPAPAAVCSQLQTEAFTDDEDDCHGIADGRGR